MNDSLTFKNEDLVLRVSENLNPSVFDLTKYEKFLDALCGQREYQKEAIRTTLRFLAGGEYANLDELAEENYRSSDKLQERYGTFNEMRRHLQFPDTLACSIDLATATGKSYFLYGLARIMLAEGIVDRVLVLCPTLTIEDGLITKFKELSRDGSLSDLLPIESNVKNPKIITGAETITEGAICVENIHATYYHVSSSIRRSLEGRGERTLVLNDEAHHMYNRPIGRDSATQSLKKWKEFLQDPLFSFKYIVGCSGTCYIENDYFSDVIFRYSLSEAIEDGFAKSIEYVSEDTSQSEYEKFQKIYDNHLENKNARYRKVKPLTILVTRNISSCKKLTESLVEFIAGQEGLVEEDARKKVLIVTSAQEHRENVLKLKGVDKIKNPIEWITSVSMLTEGWDVQNVFQIVPHEERAFNSKLLIAQVLGRGLRIPAEYRGERSVVTVFNHDSWSGRIKHLVDEVMEVEKRIYSFPVEAKKEFDFSIHNIDYEKTKTVEEFEQEGEYEFTKGYVSIASQVSEVEPETVYTRVGTGEQRKKRTLVKFKMYTIEDVAEAIHYRLSSIDLETNGETSYSEKYDLPWLKKLIKDSLKRVGETGNKVSEENRQRFYRAFNVLHRSSSKVVRHVMTPNALIIRSTSNRPKDSVAYSKLRRGEAAVFADELSFKVSEDETIRNLEEVRDDDSLPRFSWTYIENRYFFKTPLNVVIADHRPEREFIRHLIREDVSRKIDGWIKSTDRDFYPIEFSWRKGEHPKRATFNPDFFIRAGDQMLVVEIKGDEEIDDPSLENKGKYKYASAHFGKLNKLQSDLIYSFHFLTPVDFEKFSKFVLDEKVSTFVSSLDVTLTSNGD